MRRGPSPAETGGLWLAALVAILGASLAPWPAYRGPGLVLLGLGAAGLLCLAVRFARQRSRLESGIDGIAQRLREFSPRSPGQGVGSEDRVRAALESASQAAALISGLRAGERDLREMFDAVDAAVIASDAAGLVILCNHAASEFVGRPASSLVGRRIEDLLTQAELIDLLSSARDGHSHARQVRIQRPNGSRVFEVTVSPLARGPGAPGAAITLRDVTEQARSVQVKTDFVVNASHEMRTPIAALRLAAETLESGGAEDPAMLKRLVAMISGHVARLEDLTHDLLDLSRLESPELKVSIEPVPGAELAEELGQLFAGACAERNLTLAFEFDPALESLRTDRGLLLLILKNLIDNATKFADEGSTVRVIGRALSSGESGSVRFEVIDKGLGIPLNQQDRIFERFYQIDEARTGRTGVRKGTGLGLAIVKHAVRTLGGQVRVQSVWRQGTTMIVELPGVVPAAPGAAAPVQRTLR